MKKLLLGLIVLVSCNKAKDTLDPYVCEKKGITGKFFNIVPDLSGHDTLLLVEKSDSVFADFYSDLNFKGKIVWSGPKTCDAILKLRIKQDADNYFHKISLKNGMITDSLFSNSPTQVRYFKELK